MILMETVQDKTHGRKNQVMTLGRGDSSPFFSPRKLHAQCHLREDRLYCCASLAVRAQLVNLISDERSI